MEPSHLPCSSLTHPAAILTPSIGVLRWIRANTAGMTPEDAGLAASDAVYKLCRELDIPSTLREVGVPEEGLEFIASATLHDRSLLIRSRYPMPALL